MKKIIAKHIPIIFILPLFLFISLSTPKSVQALSCCGSVTQGDPCLDNSMPPKTGTCQEVNSAAEELLCGAFGFICKTANVTLNPGTYMCSCLSILTPDGIQEWDCRVTSRSCASDHIPNSDCNPHGTYNICSGEATNYCTRDCIEGTPANEGEPCTSNTDCDSKVCGPSLSQPSNRVCLPPISIPTAPTIGTNIHGDCGPNGIDTALGCIPFRTQEFTSSLLNFIIGLAGAISLIIMLVGTMIIMTGGGNPEQVKKGQEIITGAIVGLLFIIFSGVILKTIAGDIIKLPGFM